MPWSAMNKRARRFTPEEDKFLLEHVGAMSYSQMGRALGRTHGSVWYRVHVLGREKKPAAQKRGACYHRQSLCWSCRNAVPNTTRLEELGREGIIGCPWSVAFQPVEGWQAVKVIKSDYNPYESYDVRSCPMWEEDGDGQKPV